MNIEIVPYYCKLNGLEKDMAASVLRYAHRQESKLHFKLNWRL